MKKLRRPVSTRFACPFAGRPMPTSRRHIRIDPKFFERVDWVVDQALKRKLIPIVNMHHYDGIFAEPDKHRERFVAIWQQIAEHYKNYSPVLVFELLNEPNTKLTAEKWNKILSDTLKVVRRSNPTREIVVGPVGWNGINDLATLELPEDDRHLIVTVHYYNPFQFTHQGASWAGAEAQKWLGTKWTGTKAERQAVVRDLDKAIAWAVEHRRPMYLGEFGAYSKADMESRARWTNFVADEALKRKMSFAYWEFCSGFGVYDPQKNQWIEPLKTGTAGGRPGWAIRRQEVIFRQHNSFREPVPPLSAAISGTASAKQWHTFLLTLIINQFKVLWRLGRRRGR